MPPFPKNMTLRWQPGEFADTHRSVAQAFGAEVVGEPGEEVVSVWSPRQAEAWQLLHLFLYDLFCHQECARHGNIADYQHLHGEAEAYTLSTAAKVLPDYERQIGAFY